MKRIFYFVLAAVICVASCQKVDPIEQIGKKGEVAFTVNLPGSIGTKAISDGEKALKLFYATYTDGGKMIESLSNTTEGVAVSGKKATITLQLVKDLNYDVVFWAQADGCKAFTFDWKNASMTVDYNGDANDDYRDAFYAVRQDLKVTDGVLQETVYLYRPFAQINFGAADYQFVVDYYDEASVDAGMESALVSAQVPNTLNLLDETLGASVAAADFKLAVIPNDPRLLEVNGVGYKYVSMNYILAPKVTQPDMLESITANFQYTAGNINRSIEVKNVPYLRNHRTNILGNFFTETAILNIVIDEEFEQPDYDMYIPLKEVRVPSTTVKLEDVLADVAQDNKTENYVIDFAGNDLTWTTGAADGSTPFLEEGSQIKTLTLRNGTITAEGSGVGPIRVANGGTLILDNMKVIDNSVSYAEGSWEFTYLEFDGSVVCTNTEFMNPIQFEGTDAVFELCTFHSASKEYGVWVANGMCRFLDCKFVDYRGLKMHEAYGSEIGSVYVDGCTFGPLSEKPGVAIGTLNAATEVTIQNSIFDQCQPGDQSLYIYESDTNVADLALFVETNNTVK